MAPAAWRFSPAAAVLNGGSDTTEAKTRPRMPPHFVLTAITRNPVLAECADAAGVDRVGVDIERLNKPARQGHIDNARISDHELADLDRLAPVLRQAALFARLNPLHDDSKEEVEDALARGTTALMLPFFTKAAEVEGFVRLVDKRAKIILLLETAAAMVRLHDILAVPGIDEVMVGLNDLHLSTGLTSHFELVASEVMSVVSEQVLSHGIRFGFGGLARADDADLPVPSDLVLAQHARLGSTSAWLSRSFFGSAIDLGSEVARLRGRLSFWAMQPKDELIRQRELLRRHLRSMAKA